MMIMKVSLEEDVEILTVIGRCQRLRGLRVFLVGAGSTVVAMRLFNLLLLLHGIKLNWEKDLWLCGLCWKCLGRLHAVSEEDAYTLVVGGQVGARGVVLVVGGVHLQQGVIGEEMLTVVVVGGSFFMIGFYVLLYIYIYYFYYIANFLFTFFPHFPDTEKVPLSYGLELVFDFYSNSLI